MPLIRNDQITIVPAGKHVIPILTQSISEVTVTNTLVETTLASFTLPGGQMAINDAIMIEAFGSSLINAAVVITMRLKYGGSTIATAVTPALSANATTFGSNIVAWIKDNGATNAQRGLILWSVGSLTVSGQSTGAVDSTASQTVALTMQYSVASVNLVYVHWNVSVHYLTVTA